jgi:hypothetical protein
MNPVPYDLYRKTFPAGAAVSLAGSAIDFVVLMKPAGATGLRQAAANRPAQNLVFLSTGRRIHVPALPGAPAREISIYDLSGKCLARAVLGRETSVFDAGEAAAVGLHLIRVRGL